MASADPRIASLAQMGQCAYRLGMAFGAAAEAAQGTDKWLDYFHAFDRCFFSVRVGIALELRLERGAAASRPEPVSDREDLDREALSDRDDADDGPERDPPERDRDREAERASFPILIRTLERVAADTAALPGPEPAELPALRELLAQVRADPAPAKTAGSQPSGSSLRAHLSGSGALGALTLSRPPPGRAAWRGSG
jgi:hypothetical protein